VVGLIRTMGDYMNIKKELVMQRCRRPWLAALLTLIWPGLGQLYCGKALRAAVLNVVSLIILILGILTFVNLDSKPINFLLPVIVLLLWWLWMIVDSAKIARLPRHGFALRAFNRWYIYLLVAIVGELVWGQVLTNLGYQAFKLPNKSMEASLLEGDYLFADMNAYHDSDPEVNDLVVFLFPKDGTTKYIKRCAAGPGDTVEFRDRVLFVNGEEVSEPETVQYIRSRQDETVEPTVAESDVHARLDNFGPFVVPDNNYFMLGDNRDNSYDSRWWGPVPRDLILGRPVRIHWSHELDRIGMRVQ